MKTAVLYGLLLCGSMAAFAGPYPGTCFPDHSLPLPDPAADEPFIASAIVDLRSSSFSQYPFAVSVYRRACPGGGAALLVKFRSLTIPSGEAPAITIIQGATVISSVPYTEYPYSLQSVPAGQNFNLGAVVVLNTAAIDYTKAMSMRITGQTVSDISIPTFDPSQYPAASESVPITGYLSGSYFDPAKSGEGILVEIDPRELVIVSWYTFDDQGNPFWMVGSGPVCVSLTSGGAPLPRGKAVCVNPPTVTEVTLRASRGGGFAGAFDPTDVESEVWGKLRLEWASCSEVKLTLAPSHSNPGLPAASGERTWTRLTSVQGARCN